MTQGAVSELTFGSDPQHVGMFRRHSREPGHKRLPILQVLASATYFVASERFVRSFERLRYVCLNDHEDL